MTKSRLLRTSALILAAGLILTVEAGCQKSAGATQSPINANDPNAGPLGGQSDPGPLVPTGSGVASGGQARYAVPYPPPALPTYDQPPPPREGDIWTPGFWAWDDQQNDYYWTPGTWVAPPRPNVYWTPGYWRDQGDGYGFVPGYWGALVGFYGGVNYGWGYGGQGYDGGRWQNNQFYYNRDANNLGHGGFNNVYGQGLRRQPYGGVSFNGGRGGLQAQPTSQQARFDRGAHLAPTQAQAQHYQMARGQPGLLAGANHGRPPIAATANPGRFQGRGVVTASQSNQIFNRPAQQNGARNVGGQGPGRPGQGGQAFGQSRPARAAQAQGPQPSRAQPGPQGGPGGRFGGGQGQAQARAARPRQAIPQPQQTQQHAAPAAQAQQSGRQSHGAPVRGPGPGNTAAASHQGGAGAPPHGQRPQNQKPQNQGGPNPGPQGRP